MVPELCFVLLAWAATLSGYPMPAQCPEVRIEGREFFVKEVCRGPCRVVGLYPGHGDVIWLHQRLDLTGANVEHASVVVHEMVHYLQWLNGAAFDRCEGLVALEKEAYAAQQRYLTIHGSPKQVAQQSQSRTCF
jgi:hypothetical protein